MLKKIAVLCLVSFCGLTNCFAEVKANLNQESENILSLARSGDYANAKSATDKLIADFPGDQNLPEALYPIGELQEWPGKFQETKRIYQLIVQKYPDSTLAGKARLGISRVDVLSLIMSTDFDGAKASIDKMEAEFSNNPDLPETLYWITERYRWLSRFEDEKRIYQEIIQNHPASPYASKARLGVLRATVMSNIMAEDFSGAEAALDQMKADFPNHPDLPETFYWITERYRWFSKFDEEKQLYQEIMKHPNSPYAVKAELGFSRAAAMSLIMSKDFDGAKSVIEKMSVDFAENPDLPETLYWIAERYEWHSRYQDEKTIFQQITQKYPDNPYTKKAQLGIPRAEAMLLIMSNNFDGAKVVIDKMLVDFAENPDLPDTLRWIAERYEWLNKFTEAESVYQQIRQKYPKSSYADRASLSAVMADVRSLITSRDYDKADKAINKAANDFSAHQDWPRMITLAGEQYYKEGLAMENEGLSDKARDSFERAVGIWARFINEHPDSELIPEVCCWAGDCYVKLGKFEDSLRCFQRVVDNHPSYKYAWHALFMVGRNYESMKDLGLISESVAEPKIKAAYTRLLKEYPTCTPAKIAQEWIESNNSK